MTAHRKNVALEVRPVEHANQCLIQTDSALEPFLEYRDARPNIAHPRKDESIYNEEDLPLCQPFAISTRHRACQMISHSMSLQKPRRLALSIHKVVGSSFNVELLNTKTSAVLYTTQ